jgi:hypothetical protein
MGKTEESHGKGRHGADAGDPVLLPGGEKVLNGRPRSRHPDAEMSLSFPDFREQFEGGVSPVRQEVPFPETIQMEKGQLPLAGLAGRQAGIEDERVPHIGQSGEVGVGRSGEGGVHPGNERLRDLPGTGKIDPGAVDRAHSEPPPGPEGNDLPEESAQDAVGFDEDGMRKFFQSLAEGRRRHGGNGKILVSCFLDHLERFPNLVVPERNQGKENQAKKRQPARPGKIGLFFSVFRQKRKVRQRVQKVCENFDHSGTVVCGGRKEFVASVFSDPASHASFVSDHKKNVQREDRK